MREVTAYLGLGANLGDREGNIRSALAQLEAVPGVRVVRCSRLQPSAPMGAGPPQPEFLNGVAELRTTLPAAALLALCQAIERAAGRLPATARNQPRPLDLDLLLYGSDRIDGKDLIVPHPRLWERPFVVEPLRELGVDAGKIARWQRPAVLRDPAQFAALCGFWQGSECTVGLVPTMGALHRGHQSLMQIARGECDRVVATIFVNPLQFGQGEDFAAYPRDLDADLRLCTAAGVDAVFAPEPAQMYGPGFCSRVAVGAAAQTMEGQSRPGHFEGVATVVARLFALSRPQRAYFGKKDAQQCAVIARLRDDLGFPTRIVECPIVREPDGLALSSRNVYLADQDRKASTVLYRALRTAQQAFAGGERDRDRLVERAAAVIRAEPRAALEYVELRSEGELRPLPPGPVAGGRLLVVARFTGGTRPVRLLDNMSLPEPLDPGDGPDPAVTVLRLAAQAKLNLGLEITGRLPNGYHTLATLLHAVELHDDLWVEPAATDALTVSADHPRSALAPSPDNLVLSAARAFRAHTGLASGFRFHLHKRVPAGGGLGGGSSDAAAALRLCNALHGAPLDAAALHQLAAPLGADVAFFLRGGSQWGRGIGNELTPVAEPPHHHFLLLVPPFGCPTAEVYKNFAAHWNDAAGAASMRGVRDRHHKDSDVGVRFENDLEAAAERVRPELQAVRHRARVLGAPSLCLTGSGSTLFFAGTAAAVETVARDLQPMAAEGVWLCPTRSAGELPLPVPSAWPERGGA